MQRFDTPAILRTDHFAFGDGIDNGGHIRMRVEALAGSRVAVLDRFTALHRLFALVRAHVGCVSPRPGTQVSDLATARLVRRLVSSTGGCELTAGGVRSPEAGLQSCGVPSDSSAVARKSSAFAAQRSHQALNSSDAAVKPSTVALQSSRLAWQSSRVALRRSHVALR